MHPGYRDLEGYDLVVYRVGALQGFVAAAGVRMQHVKPHRAFYNAAAVDIEVWVR